MDKNLFTKKKKEPKPSAKSDGIRRRYIKSRNTCRVTFTLPREAARSADRVAVVGEFNGWDASADLMKKLRDGSFRTVIELPSGRTYRFRYLIDGIHWENDWHAGLYVSNCFGGEDSVVIV